MPDPRGPLSQSITSRAIAPLKKHGRPLMIGEELDKSVQAYLHKVRECGCVVTSRIAVAAARGIILHYDRSTWPGVTLY